jgi:hypothetical protein
VVVETERIAKGDSNRIAIPAARTLVLPEKPLQTGSFPQYAGVGIAYLGSGKWAVGFMDNADPRDRTWYRDVTFEQVQEILKENSRFCVRQEEQAIFGP